MAHDTPIRVDHVGIAVESLDEAGAVIEALGGERFVEKDEEGFTWAQYRLGGASRIELVAPTGGETFLTDFLDRHGPGLHHVTLEVADLDAVVDALESREVPVVDYAERDGYTEAFVSPTTPAGALFQLMEYHEDHGYWHDDPDELHIDGRRLSEDNGDAARRRGAPERGGERHSTVEHGDE